MNKDVVMTMRVDPEMMAALKAEAEIEGRPVSNLIRRVLSEWLDRKAGARIRRTGSR